MLPVESIELPIQMNLGSLMQFTGVVDSRGIEIYEGDIVEWSVWPDGVGDEKRIRDEVSFAHGCFNLKNRLEILGLKEPTRRLIVIGNSWENPELLS